LFLLSTNYCYPPRQVWYHFADHGGVEGLVGHGREDRFHVCVAGTLQPLTGKCRLIGFINFLHTSTLTLYKNQSGAIFINRDGKLFAYALQFMRDGKRTALPQNFDILRQIACFNHSAFIHRVTLVDISEISIHVCCA
ncbi:unnamed protein product, partial [Angiostrongylus costaricensis]|uniref:BTB_2 domain-containing protein n=1 Tax=Angiostrongylus costaricensis TaxID=334426 RepID=A0A0R3PT21_ANGCS